VNLHELVDAEAFEWRNDGLQLLLNKDCVEPVLVAHGFENMKRDESQSVPLAVFKLLKEFRLGLVVQVRELKMFSVPKPNGRVQNFGVHLHSLAHALNDRERHGFVVDLNFRLSFLHLQFQI